MHAARAALRRDDRIERQALKRIVAERGNAADQQM